jgi:photosystem II stability/assembly factor-like uncharacterized protein
MSRCRNFTTRSPIVLITLLWSFHGMVGCSSEDDPLVPDPPDQTLPGWTWQNPLPQGALLKGHDWVDDQIVMAAGSRGSLLRSEDAGWSWELIPSGTFADLEKVAFFDAAVGFAVGEAGTLLRTADGGLTWTPQSWADQHTISDLEVLDDRTAIASSFSDEFQLYLTTDQGQTWQPRSFEGCPGLKEVTFRDRDFGAALGFADLLLTHDGGHTWQAARLPEALTYNDISLWDTRTFCVAGGANHFFWTTDGGATWQDVPPTSTPDIYMAAEMLGAQSALATSIMGQIYRTDDKGQTWISTGPGTNSSIWDLEKGPGGVLLGFGNMGSILHSPDGFEFQSRCQGFTGHVWSVARRLSGTAVAGYAQGVLYSRDGGNTWSQAAGTSGAGIIFGVALRDETLGLAIGDRGMILRTTDGGASWTELSPATLEDLYGVCFPSAERAVVVGGGGMVLVSEDAGASWQAVASGAAAAFQAVDFCDADNGVAVNSTGEIYLTNDGGYTWDRQASPTHSHLHAVSMQDPDAITAVGDDAVIVRTRDGGTTWFLQESNLGPHAGQTPSLLAVCFRDITHGVAAGSFGQLIQTFDGGATWFSPPTPVYSTVNGLGLDSEGNLTVVGQGGSILAIDGDDFWDEGSAQKHQRSHHGGGHAGQQDAAGQHVLDQPGAWILPGTDQVHQTLGR